ncbi:MAG: ATP-binding protein [Pseudomonadota bacterium]
MQESFNPKRLWRFYGIALVIVALMATTEFLTSKLQLASLKSSSAAIDVSGRQRMLSQRIALFANAYAAAEEPGERATARTFLSESLILFETSHNRLTDPAAPGALISAVSPRLNSVYFGPADGVDALSRKYVTLGVSLLAVDVSTNADAARRINGEIAALGPHMLLPLLDDAVQAFEADADARVERLASIGEFAYIAMIGALILEAIFIFLPLQKVVARSFSEIQAARLETAEALEKVQKASQLKTDFLANMSHEIRTPLNAVLGMAQLLSRTELNDQQRSYTKTVLTSGRALLAVINDVLDIAKIESGLMELHNDAFYPDELVECVKDAVLGAAAAKKISIVLDVDDAVRRRYSGDQARLQQVLINLVGNAIKFSDHGSIVIGAEALDPSGGLRFSVSDDGPGIALDQQGVIFERFGQADAAPTRKKGGTGLGLAISKEFIDLMGGEIGVDSAPGDGATFWIRLPSSAVPALEDALEPNAAEEQTVVSSENERPTTWSEEAHYSVLLAEDNEESQFVVASLLKFWSTIDLTVVENGQEALAEIQDKKFDLVLMDIDMPVMAGDEAIEKIRNANAAYADVPIIVVTSNALKEQRDHYLNIGATAFISKPIDIDRFEVVVRQILSAPKGERVQNA